MGTRSSALVAAAALVVLLVGVWACGRAARGERFDPAGRLSGRQLMNLEGPFGSSPWLRIRYDPAYSAPFDTDYCRFLPAACSGFAMEPFRGGGRAGL